MQPLPNSGDLSMLAWEPGYKSRLHYSDAEYFNLSDKDTRIATTGTKGADSGTG
jgi:hypothetical protein